MSPADRPAGRAPRRLLRSAARDWRPDVVALLLQLPANMPEIVDLAKRDQGALPDVFVFVGGHSASFTAADIL